MKRSWLLLTVTTLALVASGVAVSGEIYKWTDDAGNVHYEDRPTEDRAVQRLQIASRATNNSAIQQQRQAKIEAKNVADQVASEAPENMSRAEKRAETAKRQEQCQKYRDQLDQVLRSRHLYRAGDDGERTYLDESEKQAERNRVEDQVKEYCGA